MTGLERKILEAQGGFTVEDQSPFTTHCRWALGLSRSQLLSAAFARGCRHYASLWPNLPAVDLPGLPQEVLGCALLRGDQDAETFQAIRCGAMILSDLANEPGFVAKAARRFEVEGRVAHLAKLGAQADRYPEFWNDVLSAIERPVEADEPFLPGLSRLVSEGRIRGINQVANRIWLRTDFR